MFYFSYSSNRIYSKNLAKSIVNTQVSYEKDEFELYDIESETDITFCLKEFKGVLLFGNTNRMIIIHY